MDPSKSITALHDAGIAAGVIVLLICGWLLLHYGPTWVATISNSFLEHRRFDHEREMSKRTLELAIEERRNPIAPLLLPPQPLLEDRGADDLDH